jgi:glycosidase
MYYGEEIGMVGMKPDENLRTPMQWSADANAGFTTGDFPWRLVNDDYKQVNVALETADPASLLSRYRSLVHLRNQHAALRVGEYSSVESNSNQVLAFLRVSQAESLLVLINMGKEPISDLSLSLQKGPLSGTYQVVPLMGADFLEKKVRLLPPAISPAGGFENYQPLPVGTPLPGYASLVIQLQTAK